MDFRKSKPSKNIEDRTGVSGFIRSRLNDLFQLLTMPTNSRQSEGNIGSNEPLGEVIHQPPRPLNPIDPRRDRPLMPIDKEMMKMIMFDRLFYADDPRSSLPEHPDVLRQPDAIETMRKMRRHSTIYDKE